MLQEEEDEGGCCSKSPDVELSPFVTHTETNHRVNKDKETREEDVHGIAAPRATSVQHRMQWMTRERPPQADRGTAAGSVPTGDTGDFRAAGASGSENAGFGSHC